MNIIIAGIGGTIGALLRYLIGKIFKRFTEKDHPISTLFVNILGCFLIGYLSPKNLSNENRLFLITGFLGGFTTYSTFMLETTRYIRKDKHFKAILYIISSLFLGIIAGILGISIAKIL